MEKKYIDDGKDRLQKIIAERGYCSRRKAEDLIEAGKVKVDGVLVNTLGQRFLKDCKIEIDGKPLLSLKDSVAAGQNPYVYLAINKPLGFICAASDPQHRRLVTELVPPKYGRVFPIGRLDINSEGLLLLTNDGDFSNLVMHPSSSPDKVYEVRIDSRLTYPQMDELRKGIVLEDGLTAPCQIKEVGFTLNDATYEITLHEGKNREVRRMMNYFGKNVKGLRRIQIGPLKMGNMKLGSYVVLPTAVVDKIRKNCLAKKVANDYVPPEKYGK